MQDSNLEQLTDEKIAELKKDPANTFFDVKYETPKRILPIKEVKGALGIIRNLYTTLRAENPALDDDALRNDIKKKSSVAKNMAERDSDDNPATHPKLFQLVTSRSTSDKEFQTLAYCLHLRECEENGQMDANESRAELYKYLSTKK